MAGVQSVPNTADSWLKAAKSLYQERCGEEASPSETEAYSKQLMAANPGKPHPTAADVRLWPPRRIRYWFKIGDNIIFKGPDPVCRKKESPATQPIIESKPEVKNPVAEVAPSAEKVPIRPTAAKVSENTRRKIQQAAGQAKQLIGKLKAVGLKDFAARLEAARNEAEKASRETSGKKADDALRKLNSLLLQGQQEYKKAREI
jgi:hypothetical protein